MKAAALAEAPLTRRPAPTSSRASGSRHSLPAKFMMTMTDPTTRLHPARRRHPLRAEFLGSTSCHARRGLPVFGGPQDLPARRCSTSPSPSGSAPANAEQDIARARFPANFSRTRSTKPSGACSNAAMWCTRAAAGGAAEAYWASLGLGPETAADNLAKVRVRVQPMGGVRRGRTSAPPCAASASNVVDGEADLIPISSLVVGDYLDPRLARFQQPAAGAEAAAWLPVQPSGIFPWSGPIFSPGKSACWACLADRMQRNRLIREFLDRKPQARCVRGLAARRPKCCRKTSAA